MVEEWYVAEGCPHCYNVEGHFRCSLHKGVRVNEKIRTLWICPIRTAFVDQKKYFDLRKFIETQNMTDTYRGDI